MKNSKIEIRNSIEARNPKFEFEATELPQVLRRTPSLRYSEDSGLLATFRISSLIRISSLKIRISPLLFLCVLCVSAVKCSAQNAPRPNILFAIADDATWQHFSAYGCRFCNTPNFDRVAREGALFMNAFTPLPKCSPSRASILTGKYPWQLEEACDHYGVFPSKFKVFPDMLESAGYFVGYTGKGWGPGNWKKGGFTRNPAGNQFADVNLIPPTTGINKLDYASNFKIFLDAKPKDKPFCFWYGGFEPHRAYERDSGVKAGKKLEDVTVPPYLPDDPIVRGDLLDYAREIEWFDHHLGLMLDELLKRGEIDKTIIVVTADNGMPFPRDKGHIYEDACHLPLAIRWPGIVAPGTKIDDFVSFVDIAPTFVDIAGAQSTAMSGKSLINVLRGTSSARDHVILGREREDVGRPNDEGYPVRGVRTKDFFYTRNFKPDRWPAGNPETGYTDIDNSPTKTLIVERKDKFHDLALAKRGPEELYDLRSDPSCVKNVSDDPQYAQIKAKLWEQLKTELTEQQDPRIVGDGDVFDHYKSTAPRGRAWENRKN